MEKFRCRYLLSLEAMHKTKALLIRYLSLDFCGEGGHTLEQYTLSHIQNIVKNLDLPLEVLDLVHSDCVFSEILAHSKDCENILLFHANAPFIFESLSREILEKQEQFLVDYTFAEYLPWGFAPVAIRRDILETLLPALQKLEYTPFTLDEQIKKDLNSFDIEIVLGDRDYRYLKESFIVTDKRSYSFISRIYDHNESITSSISVSHFIQRAIPLLRTAPSFLQVALVEDCHRSAFFQSPVQESSSVNIDLPNLFSICQNLWEENPQLTIQFSLQDGDPCLHPHFDQVLEFIEHNPSYPFILETMGSSLSLYKEKIRSLPHLTLIFFISSTSEENYQKIHGLSGLKEKEELAEWFLKHSPTSTRIQWVRMKENEGEVSFFLQQWKAYDTQIILSQYNHFSQTQADRKVVDFTPLERFPCFSLLRELYLRADSKIALCSVDRNRIMNDVVSKGEETHPWDSLWEKMGNIYQQHNDGSYPGMCLSCDYWYIFNL